MITTITRIVVPRLPRLKLINIPQHIVQTGLLNQPCFYDNEDYQFYLKSLQAAAEQYFCSIHAFVLLKNSVQIIATPLVPDGVPAMMQSLGRRYVQHLNRRYKRTGSLWGRYKSSLIDPSAYLLSCYRYIELQPLNHGLVLDLEAYRWSSFHHHSGVRKSPIITDHPLYLELGEEQELRAQAYIKLFRYSFDSGLQDYIEETLQTGQVLGGDRFKDQIEQISSQRVRPLKRGRPRRSSSSE